MLSWTFAEHRQLQLLKPPPPSHFMVIQPENFMSLHAKKKKMLWSVSLITEDQIPRLVSLPFLIVTFKYNPEVFRQTRDVEFGREMSEYHASGTLTNSGRHHLLSLKHIIVHHKATFTATVTKLYYNCSNYTPCPKKIVLFFFIYFFEKGTIFFGHLYNSQHECNFSFICLHIFLR